MRVQFLYAEGDELCFMDVESYDQFVVSRTQVVWKGEEVLRDGAEFHLAFREGSELVDIELAVDVEFSSVGGTGVVVVPLLLEQSRIEGPMLMVVAVMGVFMGGHDLAFVDRSLARQWGLPAYGGNDLQDPEFYLDVQLIGSETWHRFRCRSLVKFASGHVGIINFTCQQLGLSKGDRVLVKPLWTLPPPTAGGVRER